MARYTMQQAEEIVPSTIGYFSLKGDGSKALIRILYTSPKDVEIVGVHRVAYKGRDRNIECAKSSPDDPNSVCPFCAADIKNQFRIFLPVYDYETNSVKIWEKGGNFFKNLDSLFLNYPDLWKEIIEVTRIEEKTTRYALKVVTSEFDSSDSIFDFNLEEQVIPDINDPKSLLLIQKSAEEMNYFLKNGHFEDDNESTGSAPQGGQQQQYRRRGSQDSQPTGYSSRLGNEGNSRYGTSTRREF